MILCFKPKIYHHFCPGYQHVMIVHNFIIRLKLGTVSYFEGNTGLNSRQDNYIDNYIGNIIWYKLFVQLIY